MTNTLYWYFLGIIYLIILTYQDFKNNMNVDDRKNAFMLGLSVSLFSHFKHSLLYGISIICLIFALNIVMRRLKGFGIGDINTLSWIMLGFLIISPFYCLVFYLIFSIFTIIYIISKKYMFKLKTPTPFYYIILLAFALSGFILKLYQ